MQKGFTLPLVLAPLLLLSLIGASVYFYYQPKNNPLENTPTLQPSVVVQKDETSDWKTYTNTQYNFSLKYPSDLIPEDRTEPSVLSAGKKVDAVSFVGKSFSFYITFHPNSNNLTINDWLSEQEEYEKENCEIDCLGFSNATEEATVAGQKVIQQELNSVIGSTNIYVPLKNGFVAWVGSTHGSNPDIPSATRVMLNKILSTFKFLDEETANWKTYTNKTYDYSFKYPEDWQIKNINQKDEVVIGPAVAPCPSDTETIHYSMNCEYSQNIFVDVRENPEDLSIQDYHEGNNLGLNIKYQDLIIDGLQAKRTTEIPAVNENEVVAIKRDRKIYSITWIKPDFDKVITKEEFEGIISTFKFLK